MKQNSEPIRLSKLMSQRGICSRREADSYIEKGWVIVDGKSVSELGLKVDPNCKIVLSKEARNISNEKASIVLNKPVGYASAPSSENHPMAIDLINAENQCSLNKKKFKFSDSHLKGLSSVGRLDIDSKGLMLFTQDGVIAKSVIGDKSDIEKEYLVRVEGEITPQILKKLEFGLELDGMRLRRARIKQLAPQLIQFILKQGRKRQIRRMCDLVGLKVISLKRVRIGKIVLGALKAGQWRYLDKSEIP